MVGTGLAAVEVGNHRRDRLTERDVEPQTVEVVDDLLLGERIVEAEFGLGVNETTELDRVVLETAGRFEEVLTDVR